MIVSIYKPIPKIEIYKDPNSPAEDYTDHIIRYNFTESVDNIEGSFNIMLKQGRESLLDKIPKRSVVKIYEAGICVFTGIVRQKSISGSIAGGSPSKTASLSGTSVAGLYSDFQISLDMRIQGVSDAAAKNKDMQTRLARQKNLLIKDFASAVWEYFLEIAKGANSFANTVVQDIIEKHTSFEVTGDDQTITYPVAMNFLNQGVNNVVEMWRQLLPPPVYEIFSRTHSGKTTAVMRQVPFEPYDWKGLPLYDVLPGDLLDYELNSSNKEVYTYFSSWIVGATPKP